MCVCVLCLFNIHVCMWYFLLFVGVYMVFLSYFCVYIWYFLLILRVYMVFSPIITCVYGILSYFYVCVLYFLLFSRVYMAFSPIFTCVHGIYLLLLRHREVYVITVCYARVTA